METRASYVAVGVFVLALVTGALVAALWFARTEFRVQNARYDIYFASVSTGLVAGSPVRISGVEVGHVVRVALDPANAQRVRVTVEVVPGAPIRSDSVASIDTQPLTGTAAIEITPGSKNAPPVRQVEGEPYPVIWSQELSIEQLVANVPALLVKISDLTDSLAAVLDEKNRAALAATLDNLGQITAAVAAHRDDLEHFFADSAADVKEMRQAITDLDATAHRLDNVAAQASDAVGQVDALVKENRAPLKEFTSGGLDQLRQLVAETHTLVTAMTRAVDGLERDPSSLLYGDRREGYRPQ